MKTIFVKMYSLAFTIGLAVLLYVAVNPLVACDDGQPDNSCCNDAWNWNQSCCEDPPANGFMCYCVHGTPPNEVGSWVCEWGGSSCQVGGGCPTSCN